MNALRRLTSFLFLFGYRETDDGRMLLRFHAPETYLLACTAVAGAWTE